MCKTSMWSSRNGMWTMWNSREKGEFKNHP